MKVEVWSSESLRGRAPAPELHLELSGFARAKAVRFVWMHGKAAGQDVD